MKRCLVISVMIASLLSISVNTEAQVYRTFEEAERLAFEAKCEFEYACKIGTREALVRFIYDYPESTLAKEAKNMIYDIDLWNETLAEDTIDAYNRYLKNSKIKLFEIEAKDAIDVCLWTKAKCANTIEAYNEYLSESKRKNFETEAKDAIDMCLWTKAKRTNTIEAYNEYLSESKRKNFETEAKVEICTIKSTEELNLIKNSSDISELTSFIQKYPNSKYVANVQRQIQELNAIKAYNENDLLLASSLFDEVGGRNALVYPESFAIYNECKEYSDYVYLSNNMTEYGLSNFRTNYPNSIYYNELSNKLAIEKAKSLSMFSYETDGPKAMSYATDIATRDTVKSYIDDCMKADKKYKRELRRQRHDANGRLLQFGLELCDFGICTSEYSDLMVAYNAGMSLKIGNYKDPLQFEVGAKLGLIKDMDYDDIVFRLPLYARLKLNICSVGENTKWYIDGAGYYNVVADEYIENDFAFSVGTGFAGRFLDLSIYVKRDIPSDYSSGSLCVGTSFKWYF